MSAGTQSLKSPSKAARRNVDRDILSLVEKWMELIREIIRDQDFAGA